ncbi:unnamed protein product [Brugia pahangi]|uniref:SPATA6 domain-containing protein n=1 Tax=Brugia pahangi TaxID=6280 RepID=A0A0N4TRI6_BRUPA|nr:unnamed protein product [Brugia pahangi]
MFRNASVLIFYVPSAYSILMEPFVTCEMVLEEISTDNEDICIVQRIQIRFMHCTISDRKVPVNGLYNSHVLPSPRLLLLVRLTVTNDLCPFPCSLPMYQLRGDIEDMLPASSS